MNHALCVCLPTLLHPCCAVRLCCRYRCLGPGYLWVRYGKPYDGFTATNAGMKAPVYVQSTWLRSRMEPNYPMRYQFVMDLIEELTLCKYKGRPHWCVQCSTQGLL